MNERARQIGTPTGSTGRRPGWFARRPAMTILVKSLRPFRSLQPLLTRPAAWSHTLAARWLPRPFIGKIWRSTSDFSVRPERAFAARGVTRRTADLIGGILTARRSLQTLSLPEGMRSEEPSPEDQQEQAQLLSTDQPPDLSAALPDEGAPNAGIQAASTKSETGEAETPPAAIQARSASFTPSEKEAPATDFRAPSTSSTAPKLTRFTQPAVTEATGNTSKKVAPPAWPFTLVSPFTSKKPSASHYPLQREKTYRQPQISWLSADEIVGGSPSSPAILSKSRAPRREIEAVRSRLTPRPMTAEQPSITNPQSPMTSLPAEPASQTFMLFAGRTQPVFENFPAATSEIPPEDQSFIPPGLRPAGKKVLQRKPFFARDRQAQREAPALSQMGLTRAESGHTDAQPGETAPFEATSQVRPPDTMLILLPPRQPAPEPGVQDTETQSIPGRLEQDWPLLSVLHRLETHPEEAGEPAALQVLRRMWPGQAALVRSTLQALASSGPGERLPAALRETMQARLGSNISDVRLHTSPLVQILRAEAFTSGRNIVFAPGHLDVSSAKGLALLGHELTHVGQLLAFKQESSAGRVFEDTGEHIARQEEENVLRIVEHGWPKPHSMELQRPARPSASPAHGISATSTFIQRQVDDNTTSSQTDMNGGSPAPGPANTPAGQPAGAEQPAPSGQTAGPLASSGPAGAPAPDGNMDALARQVYGILKNRLRAERDRHQLYNF